MDTTPTTAPSPGNGMLIYILPGVLAVVIVCSIAAGAFPGPRRFLLAVMDGATPGQYALTINGASTSGCYHVRALTAPVTVNSGSAQVFTFSGATPIPAVTSERNVEVVWAGGNGSVLGSAPVAAGSSFHPDPSARLIVVFPPGTRFPGSGAGVGASWWTPQPPTVALGSQCGLPAGI